MDADVGYGYLYLYDDTGPLADTDQHFDEQPDRLDGNPYIHQHADPNSYEHLDAYCHAYCYCDLDGHLEYLHTEFYWYAEQHSDEPYTDQHVDEYTYGYSNRNFNGD